MPEPSQPCRHTPAPTFEGQAPSVASAALAAGNPHFVRLGGEAGIARLVERFYFHMDTRPDAREIRALHPADLGPVQRVLCIYLAEWTGGPQHYSAERGHPRLRRKHLAFSIGTRERDAWMACMRAALDDVIDEAALRQELEAAFLKTADFIRNQQE